MLIHSKDWISQKYSLLDFQYYVVTLWKSPLTFSRNKVSVFLRFPFILIYHSNNDKNHYIVWGYIVWGLMQFNASYNVRSSSLNGRLQLRCVWKLNLSKQSRLISSKQKLIFRPINLLCYFWIILNVVICNHSQAQMNTFPLSFFLGNKQRILAMLAIKLSGVPN